MLQAIIVPFKPTQGSILVADGAEHPREFTDGKTYYAASVNSTDRNHAVLTMPENGRPVFITADSLDTLRDRLGSFDPLKCCYAPNSQFITIHRKDPTSYQVIPVKITIKGSPLTEEDIANLTSVASSGNVQGFMQAVPEGKLTVTQGSAKNSYATFEDARKRAEQIQTEKQLPFAPYFLLAKE